MVFSYPLIGNYGTKPYDNESLAPQFSGAVISDEMSLNISNHSKSSFQKMIEDAGIPILAGVDTRAVIQVIREKGSLQGVITNDLTASHDQHLLNPERVHFVKQVSTKQPVSFGNGSFHVVLLDFGYKKSILSSLLAHDCTVTVVPYNTTFEKIASMKPDGIVLSNGPGNPKMLTEQLPTIRMLAEKYPSFGICLGHQLLALAFGGNTTKMKFGHRGANHPVIDTVTGKVGISSQNHSYVVDTTSLQGTGMNIRYQNINDGTVEGMIHEHYPLISTQFHPEAHPGPNDFAYLFPIYTEIMKAQKKEKIYA
jgi:carbamoyl-phosphate synthase small subunit